MRDEDEINEKAFYLVCCLWIDSVLVLM